MTLDNLQHTQQLRNKISNLEEKLTTQELTTALITSDYKKIMIEFDKQQKLIDQYQNGGSSSICSVSKSNKKKFRIGMRRLFPKFSSTSEFLKWCVWKATGISFIEILEGGEK